MVATTKLDRIYNKQANGDYDVSITRWGPDYADPTIYLNLCLKGNNYNYGKYSNMDFDVLMQKAGVEVDASSLWQMLVDAEKIAMDELCYIPVFEKGSSTLQDSAVSGLVQRPVGVPYTFNYVDVKEVE